MNVTTTYERVFNFARTASEWLAKAEGNQNTKLGYAITRLEPRVKKVAEQYTNATDDINITHCSTDDKGNILRDEHREYKFTKDALKLRNSDRQKLFESAIEFKPYYATELPKDLTFAELDAFEGFVIKEGATSEAEAASAGAE